MKQYKHNIIYKITNKINGKFYIGKHKCDNLDDGYFGSGKRLWIAINKYGLENFEFHLEIDLPNSDEMDLLEQYVVNEEFLKRIDVYNISKGGKNPCMYGENNPFYNKTHSDEFKQNMSNRLKNKPLTDEHRNNISKGLKKLFTEHPELTIKFATRKGKRKCINTETGQIKFFKIDSIPDDFEIYIKPKIVNHLSQEQKIENRKKISERSKASRWFNNGLEEKFCLPENAPEGFIIGRLPTTNVGRKASTETREKMRNAKKGKTPSNKGKVFITNGIENRYILKTDPLPDGWTYGLTHINKQR